MEDSWKQVVQLKECEVDRRELILRREQNQLKDQRIANLEKELELLQKEVDLEKRIIEIKDMELAAKDRALKDLQTINDRAMSYAEWAEKERSKSDTIQRLTLGGLLLAIGLAIGLAL